MRTASVIVILVVSALSVPAHAGSMNSKLPDEASISLLEQRANEAQPREQCYLYAQLVHDMVEYSAREYAAGETEQATGILKRAQVFTHKIQSALVVNAKKLKDAQILLRHTAFRLTELLHSSDYDDQPVVQQTLSELNQAQTQAMLTVFKK